MHGDVGLISNTKMVVTHISSTRRILILLTPILILEKFLGAQKAYLRDLAVCRINESTEEFAKSIHKCKLSGSFLNEVSSRVKSGNSSAFSWSKELKIFVVECVLFMSNSSEIVCEEMLVQFRWEVMFSLNPDQAVSF